MVFIELRKVFWQLMTMPVLKDFSAGFLLLQYGCANSDAGS